MEEIIIPKQIYEVPNWIYWIHTHPKIILGIAFVLFVSLFIYIRTRPHSDP